MMSAIRRGMKEEYALEFGQNRPPHMADGQLIELLR